MSTPAIENEHYKDSQIFAMFASGSTEESKLNKVLHLFQSRITLQDLLNLRKWKHDQNEVVAGFSQFDDFVLREDESKRTSCRELIQQHPEYLPAYIFNQISNLEQLHGNFDYKEVRENYYRLQELNIGNQDGESTELHAITNNMIVYLQELWVKKMAPHAYQLGKNIVDEQVQFPAEKRFNNHFVTELFKDLLEREALVDRQTWQNQKGRIYASVKSPSSVIKEVILRRSDLQELIIAQAKSLNIPSEISGNKMHDAWEIMRLLDLIINQRGAEESNELTDEISKEAKKLEHHLRCRAYFDDADAFNHLTISGLDRIGQFSLSSRHVLSTQIGANTFLAIDTPNAYYRQPTQARDGGTSNSGMSIDGRDLSPAQFSANWFINVGSPMGSVGEAVSPLMLYYLRLPGRITNKNGNWQIDLVKDHELKNESHLLGLSVESNMSWWEKFNDIHRWIWDRRSSGLDLPRDWHRTLSQLRSATYHVSRITNTPTRVVPWDKVLQSLEKIPHKQEGG